MRPLGEIFSLPFWFSITCGTQLSFWSAVKPSKRVFFSIHLFSIHRDMKQQEVQLWLHELSSIYLALHTSRVAHISMSTQLICGPINLFSFGLYVMFILVRSLRSSRLFCKLRVRMQMNKTKLEINSSLEYYLNGTPSICSWSPTATFFLFYVSAWQNI